MPQVSDDELLRSAALQNAQSISLARQKAEKELVAAKDELEKKASELDRSLAMMRATLESTTDGILVTDGQGNITEFNRHFRDMWNLTLATMESSDHRDLANRIGARFDDPESFSRQVENICSDRQADSYDVLTSLDGRVIERFSRPQLVAGTNVGRVWSFRDITEQRRSENALRDSERTLRATFNQAVVGIAITDLNGRFLQVNEKFIHILGFSPEQLGSLTFRDLTYADDIEATDAHMANLSSRTVSEFSCEKRYIRGDSTTIWSFTTVTMLRSASGEPINFVAVIEDISARKNAEAERLLLLESERAARMEAEKLSRLKDEFLATLSHELRTPLSAILGWSHLIKISGFDSAKVCEGIEVIERNARLQTQIVADLLDMSRIITGKMRLEVQRVQLPLLIEAALESVRPAADVKGVRIETKLDPIEDVVHGDHGRLQQLMWNLLSNAVKFTPRGGKVEVFLSRRNSHLELIVADSGKGVSPEFLPHIFERFRQEDSTASRHHGGLGIGLALVKQLTDLHGGKIRVESAGEGLGTSFFVELPLAIAPAMAIDEEGSLYRTEAGSTPLAEMPDLTGLTILAVDDEPDARDLIRRLLEGCNAKVVTCASADEALAAIGRNDLSLLVSDIGMPGKDGYTLIKEIRARGVSLPALALTAFASSGDRTKAILCGFQAHLSKPVELVELLVTIASLAGRTH